MSQAYEWQFYQHTFETAKLLRKTLEYKAVLQLMLQERQLKL